MRIEFTRTEVCKFLGLCLASLIASGCGEESNIPASKGGEEARAAIEFPLGPPPASKNPKKKVVTKAAQAPVAGPGMAH